MIQSFTLSIIWWASILFVLICHRQLNKSVLFFESCDYCMVDILSYVVPNYKVIIYLHGGIELPTPWFKRVEYLLPW